jgi:hypothetical protein
VLVEVMLGVAQEGLEIHAPLANSIPDVQVSIVLELFVRKAC